jgi:hypothetical protein
VKLLDPTIELVACGQTGRDTWDAVVLGELVDRVAYTRWVPSHHIAETRLEGHDPGH